MMRVILAGIRSALLADTTLMAALGAARVYTLLAPENAPLPYIILQIQGGGTANRSPVDEADAVVSVLCVADNDADGASIAATCADRVRAVLHDANLATGGGWTAYRCQHQALVLYSETENRKTYTFAGGTYRVRAFRQPD